MLEGKNCKVNEGERFQQSAILVQVIFHYYKMSQNLKFAKEKSSPLTFHPLRDPIPFTSFNCFIASYAVGQLIVDELPFALEEPLIVNRKC